VIDPLSQQLRALAIDLEARLGTEALARGFETFFAGEVATEGRPVLAQLDPNGTCYRLVGAGSAKLERADLTEP
jgi:hypothetical protein